MTANEWINGFGFSEMNARDRARMQVAFAAGQHYEREDLLELIKAYGGSRHLYDAVKARGDDAQEE